MVERSAYELAWPTVKPKGYRKVVRWVVLKVGCLGMQMAARLVNHWADSSAVK